MSKGPLEQYKALVAAGDLLEDPNQISALRALQSLYEQLLVRPPDAGFLSGLFKAKRVEGPKGLYLWGGVGRGKSMLMDLFFETSSVHKKRRVHFHAFMQEIHEALQKV